MGKQVVTLRNVGCFIRLQSLLLLAIFSQPWSFLKLFFLITFKILNEGMIFMLQCTTACSFSNGQ